MSPVSEDKQVGGQQLEAEERDVQKLGQGSPGLSQVSSGLRVPCLQKPGLSQPQAAPQPASTSSSPSLADFQKPTDEIATLDTFIFTTEYQIAGG